MIISFVGTPLGGKTSYAETYSGERQLSYFSSGRYAREIGMTEEDKRSIATTDLAESVEDKIRDVVKDYVKIARGRDVIFDGFPRHLSQVQYLEMLCYRHNVEWLMVYIYVNPVRMFQRMEGRNRDENDSQDMLAGRARSATVFYSELKQHYPDRFLFFESEVEDEQALYRSLDEIRESIK